MNYPTISFYLNEDDDSLDIYFHDNRLHGVLNGETLTDYELITEINSLDEVDTVKLIRACNGPKRFKHAYRKLFHEHPVKILDRELRENNSSLEEYLELSYRAGLNPLPALRSRDIVVRFGGQNTISPHFTDEDIIVCLNEGFVTVLFNPWNRETETNIVNKDLKFQLEQAADIKKNREYRLKNRIVRKKIIKYSED